MNFSMFSCSNVPSNRSRVSYPRARESTAKEGSALAKPRPMSLVSRNFLRAKKDPPQDFSDPKSLVNKNWIRVVFHRASSAGKPEAREFNRDAASSSQGWKKDAVLDVNTRATREEFLNCETKIWSQSER